LFLWDEEDPQTVFPFPFLLFLIAFFDSSICFPSKTRQVLPRDFLHPARFRISSLFPLFLFSLHTSSHKEQSSQPTDFILFFYGVCFESISEEEEEADFFFEDTHHTFLLSSKLYIKQISFIYLFVFDNSF
jgi:hypothetical protein